MGKEITSGDIALLHTLKKMALDTREKCDTCCSISTDFSYLLAKYSTFDNADRETRATLKEVCARLDLKISDLANETNTSRDTLRNWLMNKPDLFDTVLKGVYFKKIINNLTNTLDIDK